MKDSMLMLATLLVVVFSATEVGANTSDITITQKLNKRFFKVGDTVSLTITVTNKGPDPSNDGPDIYPASFGSQTLCGAQNLLTFSDDQCWNGPVGGTQISSDGGVCEFNSIPVGATFNVTIQYLVIGSTTCSPPDHYLLSCYNFEDQFQLDPNPANDCAISVFRIK